MPTGGFSSVDFPWKPATHSQMVVWPGKQGKESNQWRRVGAGRATAKAPISGGLILQRHIIAGPFMPGFAVRRTPRHLRNPDPDAAAAWGGGVSARCTRDTKPHRGSRDQRPCRPASHGNLERLARFQLEAQVPRIASNHIRTSSASDLRSRGIVPGTYPLSSWSRRRTTTRPNPAGKLPGARSYRVERRRCPIRPRRVARALEEAHAIWQR
jgi:hypothetical protein